MKTVVKRSADVSMVLGSALLFSFGYGIPSVALDSSQTVVDALSLPDTTIAPPAASLPADSIPSPEGFSKAMPRPSQTEIAPPAYITPTPSYSQSQIDYFLDIAMGSEYGGATPHIRKWDTDLHIKVHGTPTVQDMMSLETVVNELNTLIDPVDLNLLGDLPPSDSLELDSTVSPDIANVNIHFVPYTDFAHYVPNYQTGNLGYAWIWWQDNTIYDATILISTVGINQTERSHLIREELTQSLGLLRDSYQYEDSIFFQLWTTTTRYSALDEALIRMLYSPKIQPGMTRQAVVTALGDGTIHALQGQPTSRF